MFFHVFRGVGSFEVANAICKKIGFSTCGSAAGFNNNNNNNNNLCTWSLDIVVYLATVLVFMLFCRDYHITIIVDCF